MQQIFFNKGPAEILTTSDVWEKVHPEYSSTHSLHKPARASVDTLYLAAEIDA